MCLGGTSRDVLGVSHPWGKVTSKPFPSSVFSFKARPAGNFAPCADDGCGRLHLLTIREIFMVFNQNLGLALGACFFFSGLQGT